MYIKHWWQAHFRRIELGGASFAGEMLCAGIISIYTGVARGDADVYAWAARRAGGGA